MSDLIAIYEDKLNEVIDNISKLCTQFKTFSKNNAESAITTGTNKIQEGEKIISQLDLEISTKTDDQEKNNLKSKLKKQKIEFDQIKDKFLKIQNEYISNKAEKAIEFCSEEDDNKNNKLEKHLSDNLVDNEIVANDDDKNKKGEAIEYPEEKVQVEAAFEQRDNFHTSGPENNEFPNDEFIKAKKTIDYRKVAAVLIVAGLLIIACIILIIIKYQ